MRIDCYLMMYLCLGMKERDMECYWNIKDVLENKGDAHRQLEAESNSTSSPPRNPGAGRTKIDTQNAYRLHFQHFLIPWKDNFITFLMPPVSPQNSIGVNGKRRNKSASRICQGAVSLSFGPLGRVSCWSPSGARPGVLHAPNPYLFSSRRYFRVRVLLRFILSSNSIAVHRFVRPHFVINTVLIVTFLFLLVFSVALAGISLLGEVIRVIRVITNGAVV